MKSPAREALDIGAAISRHLPKPPAPLIHSSGGDGEQASHLGLTTHQGAGVIDDEKFGIHERTVAVLHDSRKAPLFEGFNSIALMKLWTPDEEAERLALRFVGVKKAAFARKHHLPGGPSMVTQHTKGHRPISMDAAVVYARGFGVPLEEISPRLAQQAKKAADASTPGLKLIANPTPPWAWRRPPKK